MRKPSLGEIANYDYKNHHSELPYMKKTISIFLFMLAGSIWFATGCEQRNDPFSAQNEAPTILNFVFRPDPNLTKISDDSLKYAATNTYKLRLQYSDPEFSGSESRTLTARFSFLNGGGRFSHPEFLGESADGRSFAQIPASFDGDLFFTPDTSGRIRVQLVITDGVKESETAVAEAFFFENLAPVPAFTVTFENQVNPYRAVFDPQASDDRDGTIRQFVWTFGDGTPADTVLNKSRITHEFVAAGQYRVRLRATDNEGRTDSTEQVVTTNNQPPVAALRVTPQNGQAPLEIEYNAGGSFDPDGSIASYQISFDDGATAQNVSGKHTFSQDGSYRVLLIVKDNLGLADTTTRDVTVSTPPTAVLTVTPNSGSFPLMVEIDGSSSVDPFGGELTHEVFIDGASRYNQSKVTHIFDVPKTSAYLVRLQVTSSRTGLSSSANATVFVTNTPPVADFTFVPQNPQATVAITFTSTSFDPDSTDMITNYRWIWGDGQEESGANLRSIVHQYNVSRSYLVKLVVTDRFGGTAEKEVTITVQ